MTSSRVTSSDERIALPSTDPPPSGRALRFGPPILALSAVLWLTLIGGLGGADFLAGASLLWRPLVTIASIMVMAAVARRLGVLEHLAARLFPLARGSSHRLFATVFVLSALTAGVLNNDAAVLIVTPAVVLLGRRAYPDDPEALTPLVFAVFMAAGVAPLVVSNPMNMIVAEFAGIGFNAYAAHMLPVAVVGWIVAYGLLHLWFRRRLSARGPSPEVGADGPLSGRQWWLVAVLTVTLLSYPVVSYAGGPIWLVALAGATASVVLCRRHDAGTATEIVGGDVEWETLVFLGAVVIVTFGFRNLGLVEHLTELYRGSSLTVIGSVSAAGSALLNNHPMGHLNMLAIAEIDGAGQREILAALIGGDLGPRLLPTGSLAGLLWYGVLRSLRVHVPLWRFVLVGLMVTPPTLAVSLGVLALI